MASISTMVAEVEHSVGENCFASVIVCTYNRGELLRGALTSLLGLRFPADREMEIIVVDNASTDDTPGIVHMIQQRTDINLRYVLETNRGVAYARNRGLCEARGQWIAFFDDDQLADRDWLVNLLAAAEQRQALCVGGAVRLLLPQDYDEHLSGVCRILLSESPAHLPAAPYQNPRSPGTGNLLIQRELAQKLGGFDVHATMGGEDTDLYRRMRHQGVVAWYEPRAVIYHNIPRERLSESYMLWNARRTGVHVADIEHRHYGKLRFLVRLLLRCGQACLRGPIFLWRKYFASQSSERIGANCILAASGGYLRRTAQWYLPKTCSQRTYFQKLDFRSEREQFGS